MAKKKKAKKKVKHKTVKKKMAKRKVGKKKSKGKSKRKPVYVPGYALHTKKLEILRAVQIMPCSVLSRDMQGLRFAHTQAEKVYQVYRRECELRGLVIRRIEGETTDGHCPELFKTESGWETREVTCVRFQGVWEICDIKTGETETFGGAGDGNNNIWSANSAQTIARKQALLDYFETAWPQPTDWVKVIREQLEELGPQEFVKAVKMIIPEKIADALGIRDELGAFFDKAFAKKGAKNGNRISSKRKG